MVDSSLFTFTLYRCESSFESVRGDLSVGFTTLASFLTALGDFSTGSGCAFWEAWSCNCCLACSSNICAFLSSSDLSSLWMVFTTSLLSSIVPSSFSNSSCFRNPLRTSCEFTYPAASSILRNFIRVCLTLPYDTPLAGRTSMCTCVHRARLLCTLKNKKSHRYIGTDTCQSPPRGSRILDGLKLHVLHSLNIYIYFSFSVRVRLFFDVVQDKPVVLDIAVFRCACLAALGLHQLVLIRLQRIVALCLDVRDAWLYRLTPWLDTPLCILSSDWTQLDILELSQVQFLDDVASGGARR